MNASVSSRSTVGRFPMMWHRQLYWYYTQRAVLSRSAHDIAQIQACIISPVDSTEVVLSRHKSIHIYTCVYIHRRTSVSTLCSILPAAISTVPHRHTCMYTFVTAHAHSARQPSQHSFLLEFLYHCLHTSHAKQHTQTTSSS